LATLHNWLTRESERLYTEGESEWAIRFDAFVRDLFAPNYGSALAALPILYSTIPASRGVVWRLVLDYYHASVLAAWKGNLAQAIGMLTDAVVRARSLSDADRFLSYYVRELLLHAWLDADAPGKVEIVFATVTEAQSQLGNRDLIARYDVLRARCLAQIGRAGEALDAFHRALAALDWQPPFYLSFRGSLAEMAGRLDEAADDYAHAAAGFEALGYRIEATGACIGLGAVQARMGEPHDSMMILLPSWETARRDINRAHAGMALAAMGQVYSVIDNPDMASDAFELALSSLRGLGWMRRETEVAVERVAALKASGEAAAQEWDEAVETARDHVRALQASDLRARLSELLGGDS